VFAWGLRFIDEWADEHPSRTPGAAVPPVVDEAAARKLEHICRVDTLAPAGGCEHDLGADANDRVSSRAMAVKLGERLSGAGE